MYVRTRLQAYVCLLTHALLHMCMCLSLHVCVYVGHKLAKYFVLSTHFYAYTPTYAHAC